MKSYVKRLVLIISAILLAAGLAWIWFSRIGIVTTPESPIEAPQIGFRAPDFTLSTLNSQELSLSDFRGSPVILNFWASWCPPCKAEMPSFEAAFQEFSSSGLQIISVNASDQDSLVDVSFFIEEHGISFPIPLDQTGTVSRVYLVHSLPTTFFIDKDGIVSEVIIGGPIPLSLLRIQASQLLSD